MKRTKSFHPWFVCDETGKVVVVATPQIVSLSRDNLLEMLTDVDGASDDGALLTQAINTIAAYAANREHKMRQQKE